MEYNKEEHKPNRRQRRAMNRIGNRIVKKIDKNGLIKKVNKSAEE